MKLIYLKAMKSMFSTLSLLIAALVIAALWIKPVVSEKDFINNQVDQRLLSIIDENSIAGIGHLDNQFKTKNDFSQCMNETHSFVFRRTGDYKTCIKMVSEQYTDEGSKKLIDEIKKAFEQ